MAYADIIKRLRKELAFSQEELARELGVSFATINRWEREKVRPSRMAMKAIETYCAIHNLSHLLAGGDSLEN